MESIIGGNKLRNKFFVTIEVEGSTGVSSNQYPMFLEVGKRPTNAEYHAFIQSEFGILVELTDIRDNVFVYKPLLGQQTTVRYLRVTRVIQDFKFIDIIKRK